MIRSVLVPNRGEIAVRIARSCRELGIRSILAAAADDLDSYPTRFFDEVVSLGAGDARQTYLNVSRIIDAARSVMKTVRTPEEFSGAIESSRREARGAFGADRLVLERLLEQPRHIEFQIFGDEEGNVVHLFERDCSIQRRHQKVIEETPAPRFDDALRWRMADAAVSAARAAAYRSAGTVEFIGRILGTMVGRMNNEG